MHMLYNLRVKFSKEKNLTSAWNYLKVDLQVKNSMHKQKSNMKTKLGLFTNVFTIFKSLIKQWSQAINFVFLKKLYNFVILR